MGSWALHGLVWRLCAIAQRVAGRELATGMGRGGTEREHVVLRSGEHALIAFVPGAADEGMAHESRELRLRDEPPSPGASEALLRAFLATWRKPISPIKTRGRGPEERQNRVPTWSTKAMSRP